MIEPVSTAAILLAAGGSSRFGADKLAAFIGPRTVLAHSAAALAASGCRPLLAVVRDAASGTAANLSASGFEVVVNAEAAKGLGSSIRAGVAHAAAQSARAVILALADMPFISATHYVRLFDAANRNAAELAFSRCEGRPTPPALFGAGWFSSLLSLKGDEGARALVVSADPNAGVDASPDLLADIDTIEDLERFKI